MRISTKTGDTGTTALWGGRRISKSSLRIAALGDVDELNAWIGTCRAIDHEFPLDDTLDQVQALLFELGTAIASFNEREDKADGATKWLETQIEQLEDELPPLKNFVLPGGSLYGAQLHLARTVCRRCERTLWALEEEDGGVAFWIVFLNRLSDFLFLAARKANLNAGVADRIWTS